MGVAPNFIRDLETKVAQQLQSQRVGYLLGAGSSYLNGNGYPFAYQLWDLIKDSITDTAKRDDIQRKLDGSANGIEHALDLLDDGGAGDTSYRHLVMDAMATLFMSRTPSLETHSEFIRRIAKRPDPSVKVFSLNYDPLIERAGANVRLRVIDGYIGAEHSYFDPAVFEERIGRIRGTHRGKQFDETVKPIHLLKLHGSLGWYECPTMGVRRCGFGSGPPVGTKRLMVPPQCRKASDTMYPPYSALWSMFRGCLAHNAAPINRLVCIGYGFADEHVNSVIEAALSRTDFTVIIFAKELSAAAWTRWSPKPNVIITTETQCSLKGITGPGHTDLWSFERLAKEV